MDQARKEFSIKSLDKLKNFEEDVFISFIILYIGLNALYGESSGYVREKEKIKIFFKHNESSISGILKNNVYDLHKIVDYIKIEPQHRKLSEFVKTKRGFLNNSPDVEHFAEFIYQVRNNMFHAAKLWDEDSEAELLKKINPVLESILRKITSTTI